MDCSLLGYFISFAIGICVGSIVTMYIVKQKLSKFDMGELEVDDETEKTLEDLKKEI